MKSKKKMAILSHYIRLFPIGLRAYIMNVIPQDLGSDLTSICNKGLPARRRRRAAIAAAAALLLIFALAFLILDGAAHNSQHGSPTTYTSTGTDVHITIRQQHRSLQADGENNSQAAGAAAAAQNHNSHRIGAGTSEQPDRNKIGPDRRRANVDDVVEIGRLLHSLEMMDDDEQQQQQQPGSSGSFVLVTGDPLAHLQVQLAVDHDGAAGTGAQSTSTDPFACSTPIGTHLLTKAYKNKVDYCNIHGCTVRYILESWPHDDEDDDHDAHVRRPHDPHNIRRGWAYSPAPSILLRLMDSHRSVPWFMWMDTEALFTNLSFAFPFHTYSVWGKHFIVPASASLPPAGGHRVFDEEHDSVRHGPELGGLHGSLAVNPVIFLVKNSEWSRKFLRKWKEALASVRDDKLSSDHIIHRADDQQMIRRGRSEPNYRDLLAELLAGGIADEDKEKVLVEDGYYLDGRGDFVVESHDRVNHIVEQISLMKQQQQQADAIYWPFIVDFHGCDLCGTTSSGTSPRQSSRDHRRPIPVAADAAAAAEACVSAFQRAFHFADNQLLSIAGMQHQHLYATFA